jgi:hypothetical protein
MTDFFAQQDDILDICGSLLRDAGFRVAREILPGADEPWLLAENELFAVGLITGPDLDDLSVKDALATDEVLRRLGGTEAGAKRWDAYLVLMTAAHESDARRVELLYNTRGLRRLVGIGVESTRASITRTLSPFLPLSEPLAVSSTEVGQELEDALVINGIERALAGRYVAAYQRTGTLDNV